MSALTELLANHNEAIPLDVAALELASVECGDVTPAPFLDLLDAHAEELASRLPPRAGGVAFVREVNAYLFDELGFAGNEVDYYNPRNSCLNETLERRTGLPITLSIVYLEISRRLDRQLHGIGLPGHFVVQYNDGRYATYIDPFHRGRLLDYAQCRELALETGGVDIDASPAALRPLTKRQIILRMLNNLRGVYLRTGAHRKAVDVLTLTIDSGAATPEEYRQRGLLEARLNLFGAAVRDLERYLALIPEGSDRTEVEAQIAALRRLQAGLN